MKADNKVIPIGIYNLYNVPGCLRQLADEIERNPDLVKHMIICIESENEDATYKVFGKDISRLHACGLLHWIQLMVADAADG